MPQFWKPKVLLFKLEATYGVDPIPTGGANAILATEIKLSPMEGQDTSRELDMPWLGAQRTIPTDLYMKLSFKVELAPSGSLGLAPAWGPLLEACGCAQTVVAVTSVMEAQAKYWSGRDMDIELACEAAGKVIRQYLKGQMPHENAVKDALSRIQRLVHAIPELVNNPRNSLLRAQRTIRDFKASGESIK